jgi:colicin import membrane protein
MTEETRVNKNAELVELETYTPARIFSDEGVAEIFKIIEEKVKDAPQDISTEAGRKEIASLAYKVARSKTTVDNIGKEYVAERKEALRLY